MSDAPTRPHPAPPPQAPCVGLGGAISLATGYDSSITSTTKLGSTCSNALLESGGDDRSISNFVVSIPNAERSVGTGSGFEFGGSVGHFKRSNLTAQRSWMLADRTLGQSVSASNRSGSFASPCLSMRCVTA